MKRTREENKNEKISPSPTQPIFEISTGDMSGKIYIPMDITVEILKKLSSKSLVRFQCISKQWCFTISYSKQFINSIVTRALTQPQLSHAIFRKTSSSRPYLFTFSSTDPTIINTEPILIPGSTARDAYNYVRGLITCWSIDNSSSVSIYNPTTRQSLYLPEIKPLDKHLRTCLFGYDPIEDQYKVLNLLGSGVEQAWYVFTLRGQNKWRKIEGTKLHWPCLPTVCINGVIYYRARTTIEWASTYVLMSFDVKSEKFDQVQTPETVMIKWSTLIDYKGRLGLVCCHQIGMEIWVIEDVETNKWSTILFCEMEGFETWPILHVTRGGEIVFINVWDPITIKFLYYDPKRNCMRCVKIEDTPLGKFNHYRTIFPDHVENTMCLN